MGDPIFDQAERGPCSREPPPGSRLNGGASWRNRRACYVLFCCPPARSWYAGGDFSSRRRPRTVPPLGRRAMTRFLSITLGLFVVAAPAWGDTLIRTESFGRSGPGGPSPPRPPQ